MPSSDFQRALAVLRANSSPAERALAAAFLAAEFVENGKTGPEMPPSADAATRMFGYGVPHDQARTWDGRSARSGTITYIAEDRFEQYVGQSLWIVYDPKIFADTIPSLGDQIRVASRNGSVAVERIGPNRLGSNNRSATSGMAVVRETVPSSDEIAEVAELVARRYSGSNKLDEGCTRIDFSGGAELRLRAEAAAIRLEVTVRLDRPSEAHDAECALVLCAALLTSDGSAATDDSGAVFTAERLYGLAGRNGMRADWFGFASAAVKRTYPSEQSPLFEDSAGELLIYVDRELKATSAQQAFGQSLALLANGAACTEDPGVPSGMTVMELGGTSSGAWQSLFDFAYERVRIWTGFVNGTVDWRPDVQALLGKAIPCAVAFAILRVPGAEPALTDLECRRADAFVTALAAGFMKGTGSVASDASGQLYAPEELLELALYRRGIRT